MDESYQVTFLPFFQVLPDWREIGKERKRAHRKRIAQGVKFAMTRMLMLALLLALPLVGCSSTVRKPKLFHPGPASYQQYNATQFDPYPQNDMAPAIDGGRPITWSQPPSEVVRARQQQPWGPGKR